MFTKAQNRGFSQMGKTAGHYGNVLLNKAAPYLRKVSPVLLSTGGVVAGINPVAGAAIGGLGVASGVVGSLGGMPNKRKLQMVRNSIEKALPPPRQEEDKKQFI